MTPDPAHPRWRKSTRSGGNGGECVEVASTLSALRDSKNAAGPVLTVPVRALLDTIKASRLS
jgi:hypothetical protein